MCRPALVEYTPRLEKHYTIMMDILTASAEKKRNLIMGDFLAQQKFIGFVVMNTWPFLVVRLLPPAQASMKKWTDWYNAALAERKKVSPLQFYQNI
jgi:hypothetical protein